MCGFSSVLEITGSWKIFCFVLEFGPFSHVIYIYSFENALLRFKTGQIAYLMLTGVIWVLKTSEVHPYPL